MTIEKVLYKVSKEETKQIKKYCKDNNINLTQMAKQCEIGYDYFYAMINGTKYMTTECLEKLKEHYGLYFFVKLGKKNG